MTRDELLALAAAAPTCDVPTAARALGIGTNGAYDLARRDELGVRVLRLGRNMRVPTADLLAVLGLAPTDP